MSVFWGNGHPTKYRFFQCKAGINLPNQSIMLFKNSNHKVRKIMPIILCEEDYKY
jgi:hypothetical protein